MPDSNLSPPPSFLTKIGKPFKAIGRVFTNPSFVNSLKGFGQGVMMVGNALVSVLGIAAATKSIIDVWRDPDKSLANKVGTSIVNGGAILVGGLAFVVAIGVIAIAAPVIGVVGSAMSMIKSTTEYFSDRQKTKAIQAEIEKHEEELKSYKIKFEANTTLHKDLYTSRQEISELKQRLAANQNSIKALQTTTSEDDLEDVANFRVSVLSKKIQKHSYLKKNADATMRLEKQLQQLQQQLVHAKEQEKVEIQKQIEVLEKKIGKKKDIDLFIQAAPEEIKVLTLCKEELEEKKTLMFKEGYANPSHQNHQLYLDNETKIRALELKIEKRTVMYRHYGKVLRLQSTLNALVSEKQGLTDKYNAEDYPDPALRSKLLALNTEYLELRILQLEQKIEQKSEPLQLSNHSGSRLDQLRIQKHSLNVALNASDKRVIQLKLAIEQTLKQEQRTLQDKIQHKQEVYENKAHFSALFLDQSATNKELMQVKSVEDYLFKQTIDPLLNHQNQLSQLEKMRVETNYYGRMPTSIRQDAAEILKREAKVSKRKSELKVQKFNQRSRFKNMLFAGAILGLSIATLAFPPAAAVLFGVTVGVGVVALVNYGLDWRKWSRLKKEAKQDHQVRVENTLKRLDQQMEVHQRKRGVTQKQTDVFTQDVKTYVDSHLSQMAKHFIPNPIDQHGATETIKIVLKRTVKEMMRDEKIKGLSPKGQAELKAYLENKETIHRVYREALDARATYFMQHLTQDPSFDLNSQSTGLNWILHPRMRREVAVEVYQRVAQSQDSKLKSHQAEIQGQLRAILLNSIEEDLYKTDKTIGQKIIDELKSNPVIMATDQFHYQAKGSKEVEILTRDQLMDKFKSIVEGKEPPQLAKSKSLYLENTSPAEDINLGLFAELDKNLFLGFSQPKNQVKVVEVNPKNLYHPKDHQTLIDQVELIDSGLERMDIIEQLTTQLNERQHFLSALDNHPERATQCQAKIAEELQELYLDALDIVYHDFYEELVEKGCDMDTLPEETIQKGRALFERVRNHPLIQKKSDPNRRQELLDEIDEMLENFEQMVGHGVRPDDLSSVDVPQGVRS